MKQNEYLNEERYQQTKGKITRAAFIVLLTGLLIGGFLIFTGINQHSESNKQKLANEREKLVVSKKTLEDKIKPVEDEIKSLEREPFNGFNDAYYAREDRIEELEKSIATDKNSISVIDEALDESFPHCEFDGPKNNYYTAEYCSLKNKVNGDYNVVFYIFGGFIIFVSLMISSIIYMTAKRREMLAFGIQQTMPVAGEALEKIAPTIGKAGASVAKEMSSAYGDIAREISKGIKEGLKDDNQE